MLRTRMLRAAANAGQEPVEFLRSVNLANQSSDESRSLTLNTGFAAGDMLVAMTANRTSTAPTLLSGYTSIVTRTGGTRSFRVQYKIATSSSESISWTGAYGYLLALRNATTIGQAQVLPTGAVSNTVDLPDLTGLNTQGVGFIIAGTYLLGATSVDSPYSLFGTAENIAAKVEANTAASITGKTYTISGNNFNSSYAIEFLP